MNTLKKQFQRPRWFELNFPGLVDFPTYYRLQIKENAKENAPKEEDEMFFAWRDERMVLDSLAKKQTITGESLAGYHVCHFRDPQGY